MVKMTSFGLAMAVSAGLWGAACSSSSSSGTTPGDDAGPAADAAADTSVADAAPHDSAVADTAPAADSAPADDGGDAGDAGPVCANEMTSACEACIAGAFQGACSTQYTTCQTDDSGTPDAAATSGLSCKGIVACIAAGGDEGTCVSEGTATGVADATALSMCLGTACPMSLDAPPTLTHVVSLIH